MSVRAYERYERLLILAHDDLQTLELFERFLAAGQDHFGAVALAKDKGDTLGRMMSALYAINGHLRKNFSDDFPDGFFPGTPEETENLVGVLLAEIYSRRQR